MNKLEPAPLGKGGHLKKMAANSNKLKEKAAAVLQAKHDEDWAKHEAKFGAKNGK
jgi:hypothetical protein